MNKWLYNWLWGIVHKDDEHVIAWNEGDTSDELETTQLLLLTWADIIEEIRKET